MANMTPRREQIEAGRVKDIDEAEREARFINRVFGCWGEFKKARGRKWVRGANGLWHSVAQ